MKDIFSTTTRGMYAGLLRSEGMLNVTSYQQRLEEIKGTLNPWQRIEPYSDGYNIAVDEHAVGRYYSRVIRGWDEPTIYQQHQLRGCHPSVADRLLVSVRRLLDGVGFSKLLEKDAYIYYSDGRVLPNREDEVCCFLLGYHGSDVRYSVALSYCTVFVLTCLANRVNPGTDWNAIQFLLPSQWDPERNGRLHLP